MLLPGLGQGLGGDDDVGGRGGDHEAARSAAQRGKRQGQKLAIAIRNGTVKKL